MRKVALVTGAAKRIGAGCVRYLHQRGYYVVLHYRSSQDQARRLADELNAGRADTVKIFAADLSDVDRIESLAQAVVAAWGRLDLLVNNASAFYASPFGSVSESVWDDLFASNLKAPFFLTQALAPALSQSRGAVVNIVDIHAERGLPGFSVYSVAKAGLVAMTKSLAKELAPAVRVNAVAPGAILWPEQQNQGGTGAEQAEILQRIALQRLGAVEDVAKAVVFLADDADYMTGQVLTVDGGRLLFS
ncbi:MULTISPECIES: pteridine reductase [Methylomonas]|uniref:pteridine reductase n=1 Tax=Methylomonas TaxID=416 RepID=UPI001231DB8C|nr:pteridine reductase [Methylomonas rhizoryzae]